MKSRRIVGALLALGGIVAASIIGSGTANAHVAVYVAGMSGAGVDTTADGNPTYIVSFAHSDEQITAALAAQPLGRLVQALLDKAAESTDRGWAIKRLETALAEKK